MSLSFWSRGDTGCWREKKGAKAGIMITSGFGCMQVASRSAMECLFVFIGRENCAIMQNVKVGGKIIQQQGVLQNYQKKIQQRVHRIVLALAMWTNGTFANGCLFLVVRPRRLSVTEWPAAPAAPEEATQRQVRPNSVKIKSRYFADFCGLNHVPRMSNLPGIFVLGHYGLWSSIHPK